MILYVGNVGMNATEHDLTRLFGTYGKLHSMVLVKGDIGESHCFAFIGVTDHDQALKAIDDINGTSLAGRVLIVKEAKPRRSTETQSFRQRGRPVRYRRS